MSIIPKNPKSPVVSAVRELLGLHTDLAGAFAEKVDIIVAGGMAAHYWAAKRCVKALEIEFLGARFQSENLQARYVDVNGEDKTIYIDWNYNSTLGPLHEGYVDRAIAAPEMSPDSRVRVFVMAPVDLVISKLKRFSTSDQADIAALMPMIDRAQLETLAREAFDVFVGSKSFLESNLKDALAMGSPGAPGVVLKPKEPGSK